MELLKNKLLIFGLIVVALVLVIVLSRPSDKVDQDKLITWVANGYSQQFCSAIYPRIAACVTLQTKECMNLAQSKINECIEAGKEDLPRSVEQSEAKKIYDSFAQCFQKKMHEEIKQNYIVPSSECEKLLS